MTKEQHILVAVCILAFIVFVVGVVHLFYLRFLFKKSVKHEILPYIENVVIPSIPVHGKDDMGNSPLHTAAKYNHHMIAIYCLNKISANAGESSWKEFDAYLNAQNANGDTPLHLAVANNSKDVFDILLRNRAINVNIPDNLGRTPLHIAITTDGFYFIEKLLLKNANPNIADRMNRTSVKLMKERNLSHFLSQNHK